VLETKIRLKSGKDEIIYLLDQVFAKYEITTGNQVRRNTNRKNYEELARVLSEISNRLPYTAEQLQHAEYSPDRNKDRLTYPNLKYDITGGQIKDAGNGMVSHPRPFLVDACYIYLYGIGKKGFEQNPQDYNLLLEAPVTTELLSDPVTPSPRYTFSWWHITALILGTICIGLFWSIHELKGKMKTDLKIGIYQPTENDIKSLEGTWLVYIGSPQARRSEKNRYHLVVTNIVDVKYKDGYFLFDRYGANFNHVGYMQFENKNVVSIHSYLSGNADTIESPRLSLLRIDPSNKYQSVISASWNFDSDSYNDVIGIREVYLKLSDNENSTCKCKIVRLDKKGENSHKYFLKNVRLDSLPDATLRNLLDEHSIILRHPDTTTLMTHQSH
jgi:hypothetical protein